MYCGTERAQWFQRKQRLLLSAFQGMCEQGRTSMKHTAFTLEMQRNQWKSEAEVEATQILPPLKPICWQILSTQGWTRMRGSQRRICPPFTLFSSPGVSAVGAIREKMAGLLPTSHWQEAAKWEFHLQQVNSRFSNFCILQENRIIFMHI